MFKNRQQLRKKKQQTKIAPNIIYIHFAHRNIPFKKISKERDTRRIII